LPQHHQHGLLGFDLQLAVLHVEPLDQEMRDDQRQQQTRDGREHRQTQRSEHFERLGDLGQVAEGEQGADDGEQQSELFRLLAVGQPRRPIERDPPQPVPVLVPGQIRIPGQTSRGDPMQDLGGAVIDRQTLASGCAAPVGEPRNRGGQIERVSIAGLLGKTVYFSDQAVALVREFDPQVAEQPAPRGRRHAGADRFVGEPNKHRPGQCVGNDLERLHGLVP
jgi:hypothetical protein